MSSFGSNVVSALDAFNDEYKTSRASTGGVQRPPNGEWDNVVTSIEVETTDITIRLGDNNEIPAFAVDFNYKLLGGTSPLPPEMKQGQEWPGRRFILPMGGLKGLPTSCAKGKRKNLEIQLERLKGHIQTILGPALSGNLVTDLQAAASAVSNKEAMVLCRVKCNYSPDDKDPTIKYFEEFLMRKLSA